METTEHLSKAEAAWKAACAFHKISETLPDVSSWPKHLQAQAIANYKLPFLVAAANDGWQADYTDSSQPKYEPLFVVKADEKNKSGVGLSLFVNAYWIAYSFCGPRLVFKDWDTLEKCVEENIDVYTDFYIVPNK